MREARDQRKMLPGLSHEGYSVLKRDVVAIEASSSHISHY